MGVDLSLCWPDIGGCLALQMFGSGLRSFTVCSFFGLVYSGACFQGCFNLVWFRDALPEVTFLVLNFLFVSFAGLGFCCARATPGGCVSVVLNMVAEFGKL